MYEQNELIKLLDRFPDKDWWWGSLSTNPNLTMEYVEAHPDKNWDWCALSRNPNVTMEYVESHPDKKWHWGYLSSNFFKKHPFFKKKLPKVTPQHRLLLNELHQVFDMPPDQPGVKPVFKKGGTGFWEGWNACECA